MNTMSFLAEWALRSSALVLLGMLLLRVFRAKSPLIRLTTWTTMLCGSLAIPVLMAVAPKMSLPVTYLWPWPMESSMPDLATQDMGVSKSFDWAGIAVLIYLLMTGVLLLRLCIGLAIARRWRRNSQATGLIADEIEILESDRVNAPVTLGISRSVIVLPLDWRQWDQEKLDAVVAHERSHVQRHDPAVQLLSAIHRALTWHSPLSWILHSRIMQLAEEASDDDAIAITRDRESYAEILLEFMQRGVGGRNWQGVAMARYGQPEERIHRILNGTTLVVKATQRSMAAILLCSLPLTYVAAAAYPQKNEAAIVQMGKMALEDESSRKARERSLDEHMNSMALRDESLRKAAASRAAQRRSLDERRRSMALQAEAHESLGSWWLL